MAGVRARPLLFPLRWKAGGPPGRGPEAVAQRTPCGNRLTRSPSRECLGATPEDQLAAPLFVPTLDLPHNLDLTGINASHEHGELRVAIPFRDAEASQPREIDIQPGS